MTKNPTLRECAEELLAWMKEGPYDRANDFPDNLKDVSIRSWFGHGLGKNGSFLSKHWNDLPNHLQDFCMLLGAIAVETSYGRVPSFHVHQDYIFDGPEADCVAPQVISGFNPKTESLLRTTFRLEGPASRGNEHFALLAHVSCGYIDRPWGSHPHGSRHDLNVWTFMPKEKGWRRDYDTNVVIQDELRKALSWLRRHRKKLLGIVPEKRVASNAKHVERIEKAMKFQEANHDLSAQLRKLRDQLDALLETTDRGLLSRDKVQDFASSAKSVADASLGISFKFQLLTGDTDEDAPARVERSLLGKHPTKD